MATPPPNSSLVTELRRLTALSCVEANPESSLASLATPAVSSTYDADLQTANTNLRRLIFDEEMGISSLQPQLPPPNKARRLRAELLANQQAFADAGYIPPATSPLNLLLAYRSVVRATASNSASLPIVQQQLKQAARSLSAAKTLLAEQRTLQTALEKRLQELEDRPVHKGNATTELKSRNKELRHITTRSMKALQSFLGAHLVALLEIEELGGPVVGLGSEEMDAEKVLKKGQMTLEEAFKAGRRRQRRRYEDEDEDEDQGDVESEVKELLENLMNKSLEAGSYVTLTRESAVARYLVRAKVAEFHPRDARKVRLTDFGGNFEE